MGNKKPRSKKAQEPKKQGVSAEKYDDEKDYYGKFDGRGLSSIRTRESATALLRNIGRFNSGGQKSR